jgi:nucleoid DNA-binding protein
MGAVGHPNWQVAWTDMCGLRSQRQVFLYSIPGNSKVYRPTKRKVFDVDRTGEVWRLVSTKLTLVGEIVCQDGDLKIIKQKEHTMRVADKIAAKKAQAKSNKAPAKVAKPAKPAAKGKPAKVVKKKRAAKPAIVYTPIKEEMNKSALLNYLSEETEVELKAVKAIMLKLEETICGSLAPKGVGVFTLPGVCKFVTKKIPAKKVPARKAGTMVRNPRTGEESPAEARAAYTKPATVKVKVKALTKPRKAAIPA